MKITILGCGPSWGMPSLINGFGDTDPHEPKNIRTRSSILIEDQGVRILIDTGPDIREQLLRIGNPKINAICYTHPHYDHMGGAEEFGMLTRERREILHVYGRQKDILFLKSRMPYIFKAPEEHLIKTHYIRPYHKFQIAHLEILPIPQHHAASGSVGYRIGNFAYCTDVKSIDPEGWQCLKGIKTWILGCVTLDESPRWVHLAEALQWIKNLHPDRTFLTHLGPTMDYKTLKTTLPKGVCPCHDNLVIQV